MSLPTKSSKKIEGKLGKLDKLKKSDSSSQRKVNTKGKAKEKVTILLTADTHERLQLALPKIKIDFKKENKKIDKSSLIDQAINEWMENHKY